MVFNPTDSTFPVSQFTMSIYWPCYCTVHVYVTIHFSQGRIQGRGAHPPPPLKLEKIRFFGVKSWFFTRNTPTIFAPPSARCNFSKCAPPLTWNPGSAPVSDNKWSFWEESIMCSFVIVYLYMYWRWRSSYQEWGWELRSHQQVQPVPVLGKMRHWAS